MGRPVDCRPDGIEIFEPAVGRRFVPHAAPDPLLGIQRRLITRQVVQPETEVGFQERLYLHPAVPARSIDVEPDRVPPEPAIEVAERHQEPGSIAPRRFHHAVPSQERRHPSGEIESLPVLAGGGDPQALPAFGPAPAHARVQGEAGLILEDDGLPRAQLPEFFLPLAGSGAPRWSGPAGTRDWPVSGGSPTGASVVLLKSVSPS